MTTDFQRFALKELKCFLTPLKEAAESREYLNRLLARLGWDTLFFPEEQFDEMNDVLSGIKHAIALLSVDPSTLEEVLEAIESARNVVDKIGDFTEKFRDLPLDPPPNVLQLLDDLFSLLLLEYFYVHHQKVFFGLTLMDIISSRPQSGEPLVDGENYPVRCPPSLSHFDFSKIADLLTDPINSLKKMYLLDRPLENATKALEFSDRLFPKLAVLLDCFGFQYEYGLTEADRDAFPPGPEGDVIFGQANRTFHLTYETSPYSRIGLDLLVLPKPEGGPALMITAEGVIDLKHTIEGWFLEVKASGELPSLLISPQGVTSPDGTEVEAHIRGSAIRRGTTDGPVLLLGSKTGTRFELGLCRLDGFFDSQGPDYGLGFYAGDCAFVLDTSSADGFLKKLLPPDGVRADFNFGLSWSRLDGFKLCGDLGLEVDLPLSLSIYDVVRLESLYLALRGESNELSVACGLSTVLKLGPVTASAQRVGLKAAYGFGEAPEKGFRFGFLPPTGVGLAIDAAGITGGGFLNFDDANKRYTGALSLNFSEIGLAAIGLIETRLPDGSEGFALLVSIGALFQPPIQLSLGFSLSAVGGLIGVNRSVEVNALRAGLKNRTVDAILFPDPNTVVANASQLISGLRSIFPPQENRYVVGPMVRITWGSPTIIKADVGIFLEFPDPVRILLLGTLDAALPKEDKALIVIHLDVLGIIDFAKAELTFQASLYDSRILSYSLSGDSAFLLGWGHDPRFALSLGGFHPKFTPPPPAIVFSDLKRLTLNLGKGKKLQLTCRAYQALTPNSLQFGARVDLFASGGGFSLHGYLGFDALFYLSPFSFEVEIRGGVDLKYHGLSLLSVGLEFVLSGPTPWHARGKAKISLLFFTIKVRFSVTWGRKEPVSLPPVNAWQPLLEALGTAGNWGSVLPAERSMVESLRGMEEGAAEEIIIHPVGRFEVRQNVVPLGVALETIGNAPIAGPDHFDITGLTVNDQSLDPVPVEEFFARGQFEELTSDQRLSVPSFEKMKGGVTIPKERVRPAGASEDKPVGYESILIKPDRTSQKQDSQGGLAWEDAKSTSLAGAQRRASQRGGPNKRFAAYRTQPKVGVAEEGYCIANAATLSRVFLSPELNQENRNMSRMLAEQVLKAQTELTPDQADLLTVVPEYEAYEAMV